MENEKKDTLERIRKPDTMPIYSSNAYDDGDIPPVDLPKDVIPDEVPRKDGPGGESSGDQEQ